MFLYYVPDPQTLTHLTPASQAGAPRLALSLSNQVKSNALASLGQTLLASLVLDFLPNMAGDWVLRQSGNLVSV